MPATLHRGCAKARTQAVASRCTTVSAPVPAATAAGAAAAAAVHGQPQQLASSQRQWQRHWLVQQPQQQARQRQCRVAASGVSPPQQGASTQPPLRQQQQQQQARGANGAGTRSINGGGSSSSGGSSSNGNGSSGVISAAAPSLATVARPQAVQAAADDADVLIEFKDVWKSFGSKVILRGASFKIRRGEAVGIIGPSGTGKSTTLRLAAGLLQPDSGEVLIKGVPRRGLLSDDDTSDKLKVGLVFQSGALFDSLTVGENVGFLLREHTRLPPHKIQALVAESLGRVGLSGVERLYPSELSGGMKKRVALARAIVRDEKHDSVEQVLMYDEPTAGLDPVASTVVEDLIRDLHAQYGTHTHRYSSASSASFSGGSSDGGDGIGGGGDGGISSYIVVTHQHSTIKRAVDRLVFLFEGRVVWEGPVSEFDSTQEPIVRQFATGSLQGPIIYA